MLVLSRKVDQQIIVGRDVIITVVEAGQNKVRLGIQAPDDVRIDRMEIHEARMRELREGRR